MKSSQGGQIFVYIQAIQGYLGTPIGALFLWSILWKRMNEHVSKAYPYQCYFYFFFKFSITEAIQIAFGI